LFASCSNTATHSNKTNEISKLIFPVTIKVDEARSNQEIPLLSNFCDDVTYIKLKTPDNIFIPSIRDIQISKENIFIQVGEIVMVFDMEGKFLRQIGKVGRGPTEYIYLKSFCFDNTGDYLFFLTGSPSNYIFKYTRDGEFIEKLFTYRFADKMFCLNNNFVFSCYTLFSSKRFHPENIFKLATTDMSGKIIDSVLHQLYSIKNWQERDLFFPGNYQSKFNGMLLSYDLGEDTVYQVNRSGKIEPRYILDLGNYQDPIETRYILTPGRPNSFISAINPPFETANNIWWRFALNKKVFLLHYDKTRQKAFTLPYKGEVETDFGRGMSVPKEFGIINDIDGGHDFFPDYCVYADSTQLFISKFEAFYLRKILTPEYFINRNVKFPDKKDILLKLINDLTEKDDFVLMVVKLN
jgi:hypothetical protein